MADTLLNVATDELQKAQAEQARVGAELAAAQQDLAKAHDDLDVAVGELKTLNDAAASIRRQIAQTTVSADGQQLFDELDANTGAARAKQAEIVGLQERLADAGSRVAVGQDEAAHAAADARSLAAAKQAATDRQAANASLIAAATSAPLSGLPAAADVTAAGPAQDAKDAALQRLDGGSGGDLPAELFVRAEERWSGRLARLAAIGKQARDAEDRLATEGAKAGLAGKTAQGGLAFERSEAALQDFALTGAARHDRALELLAQVAGADGLNAVEKDRLGALKDVAVTANAFDLEQARDAARDAVAGKEDAIAAARLDALAQDPSADPDTDTTVQGLLNDLSGLQQALTDAENAYTQDARKALDALEAAVPDGAWTLFDDYEEAITLLAGLAAVNPGGLATTFQTDEDAYATALRAEQDNARVTLVLGEIVREQSDRVETVAQTRAARLLQALRGDE
jgi:hypothetical protein